LDNYVEILKNNDLKVTPQRLAILKYLDKNITHPTADKIYRDLKKSNPSLSKTTVYNALEMLKKHNIIQVLTITSSEQRYDFRGGAHHHFMCKNCGDLIDIDIQCPHLKTVLKGKHRIDEVHGYFKGICENCLKKGVNK
jgi:Fe2+ or Zn2+ uptake regulation protein